MKSRQGLEKGRARYALTGGGIAVGLWVVSITVRGFAPPSADKLAEFCWRAALSPGEQLVKLSVDVWLNLLGFDLFVVVMVYLSLVAWAAAGAGAGLLWHTVALWIRRGPEGNAFCANCGAPAPAPVAAATEENTSGQRLASLPPELAGWNWGAFCFTWIWGISNNVLISLLCLLFPVIMAVVLGIKGSEWAWQNRRFDSIQQFRDTQRAWAAWAKRVLVLAVFGLFIIIIVALLARIAHINGEVWSGDGKKLSAGAWPQASQQGWREAPHG